MTPYILVVTKCRDDVFGGLFVEGLPADLRRHIRILEFGNDSLTTGLAGAAAVIVMRHGLFAFGRLAACAGLVASRPLMRYFEEHALHPRLIEYPPIVWPVLRSRAAGWRPTGAEPFRRTTSCFRRRPSIARS